MKKKYYKKSLKFNVLDEIQRIPGNIILRADIANMASPRQISRCFKDLVDMGRIIKIGKGVYAKAYQSRILNIPIIQDGFDQACKEALTKLGVEWEPGSAEKAYNDGLSTQVPVRSIVRLKKRFRANLKYRERTLIVENGINAR